MLPAIYSESLCVVSYLLYRVSRTLLSSYVIQYIPLSSECPGSPVAACDVLRIQVVEIPPLTSEYVLAGLHEDVKLASTSLVNPVNVSLHVELRVASSNDWSFGLKQQRYRLRPLVGASGMPHSGMEEDEAIKVRVVRGKVARLVNSVVVVYNGADFHRGPDTVFHHSAKRIGWRPRRQRKLVISICHAFRPNEDEVELSSREKMGELYPHVTRQRRLSPCS